MKLRNFLSEHHISATKFAEKVGVAHRITVHRWMKGERIPSRSLMPRVVKATDGLVKPQDFYEEYN